MPTDPSAPPLESKTMTTRTLADYRPQHDDDCAQNPDIRRYPCGCWWNDRISHLYWDKNCTQNPAEHFCEAVVQDCTCGLDALLAQPKAASPLPTLEEIDTNTSLLWVKYGQNRD